MKKKEILRCAVLCCMLLVLTVPDVSAGWEEMEVLKFNFEVSASPRHEWGTSIEHNPIDGEFITLWRTGGQLRDDCEPGDDSECTGNFSSIDGRRISPDGELLGNPMQLSPPDPLRGMNGPGIAYNIFSNEYLTATPIKQPSGPFELHISRIDSLGATQYGPVRLHEGGGGAVMLPMVIFNPLRRNYLVAYNDSIFNANLNNIGFILDESGSPIKGPFEIGNQVGDFYAQRGAYNPTNDTYLIVWEDFRHVIDWMYDPCDVYGALLDGDGTMIMEIPVVDDYGTPDGSDQRVPVACYNPDKNEYLVAWRDDSDILDNYGIMGIIMDPDGTLKGPEFVMLDGPGMQGTIELLYVEEEKKYLASWTDTRDAADPGLYYFLSDNADIYARWLDDTGRPIGDEILLTDEPGVQMHPHMAYDSVMQRFFIAWQDWSAPNDYPALPGAPGIASDRVGDVSGTIYGMPSFLTARVVEQGTGTPIEDARVIIIGPGLLEMETTNVGGWCNIVKDSQRNGKYFIIALNGLRMAMQSVTYAGEPLQITIEVR
jgi:hypothetical protein